MNERIREIADQCFYLPKYRNDFNLLVENFAESIINECAEYLVHATEVHDQHDQDIMNNAARKIKAHFGVE